MPERCKDCQEKEGQIEALRDCLRKQEEMNLRMSRTADRLFANFDNENRLTPFPFVNRSTQVPNRK